MQKNIILILLGLLLSLASFGADWGAENLKGPFSSWGVSPEEDVPSINLLKAWKNYKKKKDVIVAIVDTGVQADHPFLMGSFYVPEGRASLENYGMDFTKSRKAERQPDDKHGHGTHIAGIIKSVDPEVKLLILKYLDPHGVGNDDLKASIEALKYAVDHNVDVINYSGGGTSPDDDELRVLKEAERKGILVVAAAGNEQNDIDFKRKGFYPASYGLSNIITVTAHDKNRSVLSTSNYGKNTVDVSAPGYRIKSSVPGGRAGYLTGTSQATAFVSGVAALLKSEYPELGYKEIKNLIRNSAFKEATLADKCNTSGRLDAAKALEMASEMFNVGAKRTVANAKKKK